jgi:hypothetical protein
MNPYEYFSSSERDESSTSIKSTNIFIPRKFNIYYNIYNIVNVSEYGRYETQT